MLFMIRECVGWGKERTPTHTSPPITPLGFLRHPNLPTTGEKKEDSRQKGEIAQLRISCRCMRSETLNKGFPRRSMGTRSLSPLIQLGCA